ncbi:hypothetical protein [Jeongeupia naejangsanensis]|uniref:Copper resistance protein D domain-containing protein n=1 Tax=Jeongeupia naejangsanensis TaxID=613195 RepID=A0ABS2BNP4_9NEIS|nr:hypothetical protein [Jeongeupia naejangsanensis]MBM3117040.1 hypothetical protein [Jeongeupia naejangsanensis]
MTFYKMLILVHVIAMMSWIGAMYFNLTLLFPMYKSQGGNRYADLMQAQGTRAAPLLYLLIVLTLMSGIGLALLGSQPFFAPEAISKTIGLLLMAGCHLYGSLVLWPRVFFALDSEKESLFSVYRLSMFISASLGTGAIVASYLWK